MVNESTGSLIFPKWQIAVAIGATASLGLGYWYLRQSATDKKAALINKLNSVSIDDVSQEPSKEETPLERAQRFKAEGNNFFKKGKYEDAIGMYQKAIDACPAGSSTDLATFYQNKAAANEQLKRWPQVVEDCSRALEHNEKYEKALYRRAKAYEIQSDWENCLEDITAVCLIQAFQNPNSLQMADRALKELGRVHAAEAMKTKRPQLTSKQFIKTYMQSFSDDPVYKLLTASGERVAPDGEPRGFLRARAHFARGEFEQIVAACTEEIESSEAEGGYHFEALSLRAAFHLLSGAQKECMDDMNTIVNSQDVDAKIKVNALIKRASLHMQLGDMDACMRDFEAAARLGPSVPDVFHHRGQIYLLMERTQEARDDFDRAVALNPNFAIAVVQKYYADYRSALARQDAHALGENMKDFRKAIVKFKDFSEAYVLFGQILTERQEYDEADKMYDAALKVDPENATILVHRGMLELQWHGNVDKGVEYMQKAIKMDDRCGFGYETLATVEVQRGNLILAVDLFNKAIELARTEIEMTHLFSLRDAAVAQLKICTRLNIGPALGMQQ